MARCSRTPELTFRPDEGIRAGLRVESILRDLGPADGGTPADGETPADSSDAPADGSAGGERSGPGPGDPT